MTDRPAAWPRAVVAGGAILLAGMISACSKPLPTTPTSGHAPLLVAFTSNRPPSQTFLTDIYLYDLEKGGAAAQPPGVNSVSNEGPCALSADGHHLAFYTDRLPTGTVALILMSDLTTHAITIPRWTDTLTGPLNPALSGDGRYLATQYSLGGGFLDLYVAVEDLVGDSLLPLPNLNLPGFASFDPSLSADGKLVVFSSNRPGVGGFDNFLYSVPGDSLIPLPGLNSNGSDLAPTLSADGRYIAFQSNRAGGVGVIDVYLYDRQQQSLVPLPGANTTLADFLPAISPDGRFIAYTTDSDGARDVWVYDVQARQRLDLPGLNDPYFFDYGPSLSNR
jgi:Tol biopolymer transport system component